MDLSMDEFYEHIRNVQLMHVEPQVEPELEPESHPNDEKIVLEMHTEEIMDLICSDYKENIRSAAERGDTRAVICIYQEGSKHRDVIDIHKLLNPHAALQEKYESYEITPLKDRLIDMFKPFALSVVPLEEIWEITDNPIKYFAVVVSWSLPTESESASVSDSDSESD